MAVNRYYGVRVEGAKYGVGFGSALAIAISYTANHSILWAIIHGILGWLYVIYFARAAIVNYADDLVICCKGTADFAMQTLQEVVKKLGLMVNEEKTRICR